MSNEIFKYQPQLVDYSGGVVHNVVHSTFENNMEQRGLISNRELLKFSFLYRNKLLEPGQNIKLKNEIKAFFNARHGSYDNFFLPSWELECRTLEAVTASDNTFKISKDPSYLGFSQTLCEAGNYIYICRGFSRGFEVTSTVHEVIRILSWEQDGDDWIITVASNFSNSYPANVFVQKAYKVNFASPELSHTFNIPYSVEYTLEFKEDIASLYQTDFGVET